MILPKGYKPVVFFSAEFAIDNDLPTYAGGLGVLAGDFMNAAAGLHFPIIGIGILYKGKHYIQHVTGEGKEEKRDSEFDHDTSFLRPTTDKGDPIILTLPTPQGDIKAKAYHLRLSDEAIQFFLSTDVDGNPDTWRRDMDTLYAGDTDSQIRQEILLGVGGMKLIEALGIDPLLYHFNEGRPVFAIWEIARHFMIKHAISFDEAWDEAREHIVYTNHTLVDAGNPFYHPDAVRYWTAPFATQLGVETDRLLAGGLVESGFSITDFALANSIRKNAVSQVHGKYCKKRYPQYSWEAITNGVHMYRWQDSDFRKNLDDSALWQQHLEKKRELEETVRERTGIGYDPNRLVISWARRLASYKQPKAIFEDIERLNSLINKSGQEVQILYAGNSHAADGGSKALIDEVIELFATKLAGHAIFIPNYNISLANHMVSGSDIWLNTPKGNLEACGTSGMKAIANGVINCTVLDGWTYEVKWDGVGFTIDPDNVSQSFYDTLEHEILPMYFERDDRGIPLQWIEMMRRSITIAKKYSGERMFEDYKKKMYKIL